MRLTLVQVGEQAYRFAWSHHHLVLLDGWSFARVLQEAAGPLRGAASGVGSVPLGPARPYREYIAWLHRQDLATAEAYWRRQLAGFTAPTPLGGGPVGRGGEGLSSPGDDHGKERLRLPAEATAAACRGGRRRRDRR